MLYKCMDSPHASGQPEIGSSATVSFFLALKWVPQPYARCVEVVSNFSPGSRPVTCAVGSHGPNLLTGVILDPGMLFTRV